MALRARLLLPAQAAETVAAQREVAALHQYLAHRDVALRLADWLERRSQLGREVFQRGRAEPDAGSLPAADITELLRACLKLLELPARERVYRPSPPTLWRVPEALNRMRRLLPNLSVDGVPLVQLLSLAEARMKDDRNHVMLPYTARRRLCCRTGIENATGFSIDQVRCLAGRHQPHTLHATRRYGSRNGHPPLR